MKTEPQPLSPIAYVVITVVGLVITLLLLFVFVWKAPDLIRNGISKAVFYVLLVPLGLSTAAFCFGAMRSYARYRGKAFGGMLELGGPAVVAGLVVIGGFYFISKENPRATFFVKVRFVDQANNPVNTGTAKLILRNATLTQGVDAQGEATFFEIPFEFFRKQESVRYDSPESELDSTVILDDDNPPTLKVKPKQHVAPPEVKYEETPEEVRSPEIKGWGKNWSGPYTFCTTDKPSGWTIVKVYDFHIESGTERSCNYYATCTGGEADTPTHACRTINIQGHDENRFDGYGRGVGVFQVLWKHPRQD